MKNRIRFAVIGAGRGKSFVNAAKINQEIELVAICDQNVEALEPWKDVPGLRLYTQYDQILNDPGVETVCLATPVPLHARQAIAALEAGKHVLSEVTAAYTLEECHDLVAAVEKSGLTYMMAENYCYTEAVLQIQNMVEKGVFGELSYASGSYIHDCRKLAFTASADLTWRGEIHRSRAANTYPTHSLGPVAGWLDINGSDFLHSTATWQSRSLALPHHCQREHPERTEYTAPGFWRHPDTVSTSILTEKGVLIDLRVDWSSSRPHHMTRYELQGTKASFLIPEGMNPEPLIWIEGRSPTNEKGRAEQWEPLFNYREEFQHPLWRKDGEAAASAGHQGGDFFILREFAAAVREGRPPAIDVYDAVTWSAITPLSAESIARGNAPVAVPNFKQARS